MSDRNKVNLVSNVKLIKLFVELFNQILNDLMSSFISVDFIFGCG